MSATNGTLRLVVRKMLLFSVEEVFRAVSDHENLPQWLLPGACVTTEMNDAGCTVRTIRKWFFSGKEEILSCVPPQELEYRITSGLPVKHHHATVLVNPAGEAHAEVVWSVEYDSGNRALNSVVLRSIKTTLEAGLGRLPEYLARR